METLLTIEDVEELGLADGEWHFLKLEYTPSLTLLSADGEIVAYFKEQ